MIPNTSSGQDAAPELRCYLNLMALEDDPYAPAALEPEALLNAIRNAGYTGVQFIEPLSVAERNACEALGLGRCGLGRVNTPEEAGPLAARLSEEGMECGTLHVGWGIEDDDVCFRLIESVLQASSRHSIPLYVETHRATIFQDMWRTVQFVKRFPELRFNGDFSHWYTGQEMVYGGFEEKVAFIQPVLERVRFMHGRIGDPGSIQVDIGDGNRTYVEHFKALWRAAFGGFLQDANRGDYILFVPELLASRIYYARKLRMENGAQQEECNRWATALQLCQIARGCFNEAIGGR